MQYTDIGIDLGTASILVYIRGKGVVLKEPSVVAFDRDTNKIKAIGEDARLMLGRTPGNIVAVRPLRQGVISDYQVTEKMMKYFIQKALGKKTFRKPRIAVCVPSGVTEVEKKAVEDATYQAGAREVSIIEEPIAAAIGAGIDISKPCGNMIVDIGGGTMTKTITVFRGDGIGPEITDAVLDILKAANAPLDFEIFDVGAAVYEKTGSFIPQEGFDSFEKNKVLLKSPITTPIGSGFKSLNVTLRQKYDLWANIRPALSNPALPTRFENVDLVTFRENTEDLYIGEEIEIDADTVHAIKKITRKASERIIKEAFEYALKNGRHKVTCIHKANILKKSDGMFLRIFEEIAKSYPQIEADSMIVDAACMNLVMHPERFDVLVMPNLYGDILSDLTSGLIGGLGLLPSCNRGDSYAMYEAVHGSAPDIAGQNLANPSALLLSACMMLDDLHEEESASKIRNALDQVFQEGKVLTKDLGGQASTSEFVAEIKSRL